MAPPSLRTFTAELKRRKVYRAAYLYIVFGLGLLGAAELILDPLGLGAARRGLVVATLAGLPIALVLAWVFDLRTETADPRESTGPPKEQPPSRESPTAPPKNLGLAPGGRRLAAIMFADMVGYTALLQVDEAKARASRSRLRGVLRKEVDSRGGLVVQFYGDGALSVFPSALGAAESALAIQRELTSGLPVPVRIGIHIGDVIHDSEGAFGDGVNVAARIESLSVPGGVLVSDKVFDEIKNQRHIQTRHMGSFRLKNVAAPVTVHALSNEGLTIPDLESLGPAAGGGSSIAVLPFMNMSADQDNEYFSDGITEELINLLTRVNGLQVTARTSSFSFKGKHVDVREIGRELGVAHVLEGSVRRSGDRVRITAQLLDASNGYHVFSETYDRTVDDMFATQDEISNTIVAALSDQLVAPMSDPVDRDNRGLSPEAHKEYLKGLFHWARWTPEGAREAIKAFQRAVEIDPGAALPHSGLANCYGYFGFLGQVPFDESFPKARFHAEKALDLDPSLGEAHVALGLVELFGRWNFEGAYEHFQKALSLNPGAAGVRHMYAIYLMATGDRQGALEEMRTAVALDPMSPMMKLNLAFALQACERSDEAEAVVQGILDDDPHFRSALETLGWIRTGQGRMDDALEAFEALHRMHNDPLKGVADLGYVYAILGRTEEAREMLARLEQRRERDKGVTLGVDFAVVHAGLGEIDAAVAHLREARDQHMAAVLLLPNHPPWQDLMAHPQVAAVYQEIGRPV